MIILNKYRVTYSKGKEVNRDLKAEGKKVADSIAEHLLMQNQFSVNRAIEIKNANNSIISFDLWEEVKTIPKTTKAKKNAKKD